jgi:hypothetical protein
MTLAAMGQQVQDQGKAERRLQHHHSERGNAGRVYRVAALNTVGHEGKPFVSIRALQGTSTVLAEPGCDVPFRSTSRLVLLDIAGNFQEIFTTGFIPVLTQSCPCIKVKHQVLDQRMAPTAGL